MRRIQLYLDDGLWSVLHRRARDTGVSVSELVREAVRNRYLGNFEERKKAMQAIVGIRKDWGDAIDSASYVRELRRGDRLERLGKK